MDYATNIKNVLFVFIDEINSYRCFFTINQNTDFT